MAKNIFRYQVRNDTAENWESKNPILAVGELGLDTTNNYLRIGDGESNFASCPRLAMKYDIDKISWKKLAEIAETGNAEDYGFKVGQTKTVEIPSTGEQLTFIILGFNHDDKADGSGKAGITFGMQDLMADTKQMNSSSTSSGGYAASLMKNTTLPEILATFPEELQGVIKEVNKVSAEYSTSGVIDTTKDKLFLFSMAEIYSEEGIKNSSGTNTKTYADIYLKEGTQYEFFKNEVGDHDTDTACNKLVKHMTNSSSANSWWLRSPFVGNNACFRVIDSTGDCSNYYADSSVGVCLGFCI